MSKKNNGTPEQLDINASDLLATIYEIQDKPEVLSSIDDLVTKLKKIKYREVFYKICEFSPKLSSALENLIKVIDHEDEKARKKEEKRGKYTIEKKYAHAFKEYSRLAAAEVNEAVRQMRELNVEAQARLGDPKLYVGTTSDIEPTEKKSQDKEESIAMKMLRLIEEFNDEQDDYDLDTENQNGYREPYQADAEFALQMMDKYFREVDAAQIQAIEEMHTEDPVIYGTTSVSEQVSDEKTKERHRQLTRLKAALAALNVLNERQQQIMKLKLALQAVLELQTETEQTPVKKGITREELERARAEKDFDKKPITIKGSHHASKKYINEANQTLRSTGAYLKEVEKMKTAKQDIEKGPTYRK